MTTQRQVLSWRGFPIYQQGFTVQLGYGVVPESRWLELTDPNQSPWDRQDTMNWLICHLDDDAPSPCGFLPELRNGTGKNIIEIRYRSDTAGAAAFDELMLTGSYLRARRVRLREVPHRGGAVPLLDVGPDIGLDLTYATDEEVDHYIEEHWDDEEGEQ